VNDWQRTKWDLWAAGYDLFLSSGYVDRARRRAFELLALRPGERVLLPGCGTGLDFAFVPGDVELTATDLSPRMVAKAREQARRLGLDARIEAADAERLPYDDGSFDAAALQLIVAVARDGRGVLEEAARVLRPGGRAVVFDKFLPGDRPHAVRRLLNVPSKLLFTDLTRRLEDLVAATPFTLVSQERSLFGGQFRIALLTLTA
jgi:phosphatidylethanolamine/phosphatidyl-N-methylethanolamine N-methyltransferase